MITGLSTRLRNLRKSKDLSANQVVKMLKDNGLDYSEQSIYKWEQGNAIPSINTLYVMAQIYSCNISYLISDDDVEYRRITPQELSILNIFRTDFLFRSTVSLLMRLIDRRIR